jgi:hypothetical protein
MESTLSPALRSAEKISISRRTAFLYLAAAERTAGRLTKWQ